MLESGLGIYKVKLASHNKRWTALLGGSHPTFDFLAQKCGDVGSLLTNFVEGLKVFRACGPPKLSRVPFSLEEEDSTFTDFTGFCFGTVLPLNVVSSLRLDGEVSISAD